MAEIVINASPGASIDASPALSSDVSTCDVSAASSADIKCLVCDKSFSTKSNMLRHLRNCHHLSKCAVHNCGVMLPSAELADHMARKHKLAFRDREQLEAYKYRVV